MACVSPGKPVIVTVAVDRASDMKSQLTPYIYIRNCLTVTLPLFGICWRSHSPEREREGGGGGGGGVKKAARRDRHWDSTFTLAAGLRIIEGDETLTQCGAVWVVNLEEERFGVPPFLPFPTLRTLRDALGKAFLLDLSCILMWN